MEISFLSVFMFDKTKKQKLKQHFFFNYIFSLNNYKCLEMTIDHIKLIQYQYHVKNKIVQKASVLKNKNGYIMSFCILRTRSILSAFIFNIDFVSCLQNDFLWIFQKLTFSSITAKVNLWTDNFKLKYQSIRFQLVCLENER